MKLAANLTYLFTEFDFTDRFAAAAKAGFKGVEYRAPYGYPAEELRDRLETNGLTQVLFNAALGDMDAGDHGLSIFPERVGEFQDAMGLAVEYARALDCSRLHVMAGIVPEGVPREALTEQYIENLRFAADACRESGIRVLLEPINSYDTPGYFLNRPTEAPPIIEAVDRDNVDLQYDVYHAQIMEGRLSENIRALKDVIGHYQIAGVPGRHEPDVGEINYGYVFQAIDETGYDGWVACEYHPAGETAAGLGWAKEYGVG